MTFWVIYDHIGRFIGLNVVSLILIAIPVWVMWNIMEYPVAAGLGLACVMQSLLTIGHVHLIQGILAGKPFSIRECVSGIRNDGLPALFMGATLMMALACCGLGIWFYGTVLAEQHPLLGMVLAQVSACTGLFVLMLVFFAVPTLVAQKGALWKSWRVSVMLALRHPVANAALLLTVFLYGVVMVTPPGVALLSTIPLTTLACCAYELLARQQDPASSPDDDEDDYLNRGFRDFLFPWKG